MRKSVGGDREELEEEKAGRSFQRMVESFFHISCDTTCQFYSQPSLLHGGRTNRVVRGFRRRCGHPGKRTDERADRSSVENAFREIEWKGLKKGVFSQEQMYTGD